MYRFSKRMMDLFIAIIALCVLSPILLPCMLILWLTGEHYVWYLQERIGYGCKPFKIIKFATMLKASPNMGTGDITVRKDPRVLPFGNILRKTKVNELPQIFNVIYDNMSIIGPRPLTPNNFNLYSDEVKAAVGKMKPGITGIGSVIFRDEEKYVSSAENPKLFYAEKISPYKGELEIWYSRHASLLVDIKLVFLTAWVIVFPASDLPHRMLKGLPEKPEWMNNNNNRQICLT